MNNLEEKLNLLREKQASLYKTDMSNLSTEQQKKIEFQVLKLGDQIIETHKAIKQEIQKQKS